MRSSSRRRLQTRRLVGPHQHRHVIGGHQRSSPRPGTPQPHQHVCVVQQPRQHVRYVQIYAQLHMLQRAILGRQCGGVVRRFAGAIVRGRGAVQQQQLQPACSRPAMTYGCGCSCSRRGGVVGAVC